MKRHMNIGIVEMLSQLNVHDLDNGSNRDLRILCTETYTEHMRMAKQ